MTGLTILSRKTIRDRGDSRDSGYDLLQAAITSAISNVEGAGFRVLRVEMEREAIPT